MASGKTPMTDTVNALRTKHGLHCATNPDGMSHPKEDASIEDRAAFAGADRAYRREMKTESRAFLRRMFLARGDAAQQPKVLTPAERRKYHAELRLKQIVAAKERRPAT